MGRVRIFPAVIAVMFAASAVAQDETGFSSSVSADLGFGRTDNITRAEVDPIESDFQILGFTFDMRSERRRFFGALEGDVEVRNYSEGEVLGDDADEILGSLDGTATFAIVPDRVDWDFGMNSGQARSNPLDAIGPANREQVTILSTGPTVSFPLGGRSQFTFGSTYTDRDYETSGNLDSSSTDFVLAYQRAMSTVTDLGLEFSQSKIDYDLDVPGYDFQSLYVTYQKQFATGGIEVRVGSGRVETGGTEESTPVFRFVWDRQVGSRSGLNFWASRELTDPGVVFQGGGRPGLGIGGAGSSGLVNINNKRLQDVALGNDPLKRSSYGLAFDIDGARSDFFVSVGMSEDEIEGTDNLLANDGSFVQMSLGRDFNTRWRGDLGVWWRDQQFQNANRDSEDTSQTLSLTRRLGPRAGFSLAYQRNRRESDTDPSEEVVYVATLEFQLLR